MRICRFKLEGSGQAARGDLIGDTVVTLDENLEPIGESFPLAEVSLLPPVTPSKVVCVGRNYAEHARELGNDVPSAPLLFLKATSSVIGHGQSIVVPRQSEQVEHEAELAVVIGRSCKDLNDSDDPFEYVFGYTCLNDVTARDIQRSEVQFTRAKSFDTFCPIGPYIQTEMDTSDVEIICRVNDEIRQRGGTSQMVFPVPFLIRYISRQMTLNAGDVIATGTPSGVARLRDGDVCEIEIDGIGILSNRVMSSGKL